MSYTEIPNFKKCTAPGHESVLMFGKISGVEVVLMKGRYHLYEGYTVAEVSAIKLKSVKNLKKSLEIAENFSNDHYVKIQLFSFLVFTSREGNETDGSKDCPVDQRCWGH